MQAIDDDDDDDRPDRGVSVNSTRCEVLVLVAPHSVGLLV